MDNKASELSEETKALAQKGREGLPEDRDPLAPQLSETPRPKNIPEKFWDPVAGEPRLEEFFNSYSELERKLAGGSSDEDEDEEDDSNDDDKKPEEVNDDDEADKDEDDADDDEKSDKDDDEDDDKEEEDEKADDAEASEALQSAIEEAQQVYAEKGELDDDARKKLVDMGIPSEAIDYHIAGVQAYESALWGAAEEAAGSRDNLNQARIWASENWTPKQIAAFDSQVTDVETVGAAVETLMSAYNKANPSEGELTNKTTGMTRGSVYESLDEFHADLSKADETRDRVARRKAIDKLRRSRKAGTIKSNRRQPFGE